MLDIKYRSSIIEYQKQGFKFVEAVTYHNKVFHRYCLELHRKPEVPNLGSRITNIIGCMTGFVCSPFFVCNLNI